MGTKYAQESVKEERYFEAITVRSTFGNLNDRSDIFKKAFVNNTDRTMIIISPENPHSSLGERH